MKRKFRVYPNFGRITSNTSTHNKRYIRCATFTEPTLSTQESAEFEDEYGSYPVKEYFLASPGYYGCGGYGSDWCGTYYKLADGRCLCTSPYSGDEFFDNESDMLAAIEYAQDNIREEIAELEADGEMDWSICDNYDFDLDVSDISDKAEYIKLENLDYERRRTLATRSDTSADILMQLADDRASGVLLNLAMNPNTPTEALAKLANADNANVRCEVATNPNVSVDILEQLVNDPMSMRVCAVAQAALDRFNK